MNLLVWDFDGTLAHRDGLWFGSLETIVKRHHPEATICRTDCRPFLAEGYRWHKFEDGSRNLLRMLKIGWWWR